MPTRPWAPPCTRRPYLDFIPKTAIELYNAHAANDTETCNRLIRDFFIPYIALRNQGEGYAVSIVKGQAPPSAATAQALCAHPVGPEA